MMKKPIFAVSVLLCLWSAIPACAEIVLIANVNNPATRMFSEQAAQFFLGKSNQFTPIDQAKDSVIRVEFYEKVTNKSLAQVGAIWSKIAFSGKGEPPKEMRNDAEVKKAVAADPSAIGYINKSALDATVKVLLTLQ